MAELAPQLAEFKAWFSSVDGFGEYLRHFLTYYGPFFREYEEDHMFVYTKLHKEFCANMEGAVNAWLASQGMTEEHLEAMLTYAQQAGDGESDQIVNMLLHLMDYPMWVQDIFALKRCEAVCELLVAPTDPEGWEKLGLTEVEWNTDWWEAWTEAEWNEWFENLDTFGDWEDGWWEEKQEAWAAHDWTEGEFDPEAPPGLEPEAAEPEAAVEQPGTLFVVVPEGVAGGDPLTVQTADGQLLQTTVPDGLVAGDTFSVAIA